MRERYAKRLIRRAAECDRLSASQNRFPQLLSRPDPVVESEGTDPPVLCRNGRGRLCVLFGVVHTAHDLLNQTAFCCEAVNPGDRGNPGYPGVRDKYFIMLSSHNPKGHHLLAALPAADYERLQPHLEKVPMELGWALYESGGPQGYMYFPIDSIVSLLYVMEDGASAEIAVVGNEGVVGIALFMGGGSTPSRAVVQSAGSAYRLQGSILKAEFDRGGALQYLLLRYTQALITQMAQTAVCNRHHTVEQQLCRWLLLSLDRLSSNDLVMTQELIANMLGVRREGVTEAAGRLQAAGLFHYSRGRITVLDRPKLEARVCECYVVVKRESDRLLQSLPQLNGGAGKKVF
jgi:CRP-like cAMP-binding protein